MKRLQITLDDDLYNWLTKEIKEMKYGSYSHAINYALKRLHQEDEKKEIVTYVTTFKNSQDSYTKPQALTEREWVGPDLSKRVRVPAR